MIRGVNGKMALVCASTKGLGFGTARAMGVNPKVLMRRLHGCSVISLKLILGPHQATSPRLRAGRISWMYAERLTSS